MDHFIPEINIPPESDPVRAEWFKQQNLAALRESLAKRHYPGYPTERLIVPDPSLVLPDLPDGPWFVEGDAPSGPFLHEVNRLTEKGYVVDFSGRPLHPWLNDMLTDPEIGVVTGQGFYWHWGPNDTADAIIIRHDLNEPHVLLIQRQDTGQWALPGGFKNRDESDMHAAVREAVEETGVLLTLLTHTFKAVYKGPLADLRVTAHAWPETAAFRFDLLLEDKRELKILTDMMVNRRWKSVVRSLGHVAFKEHVSRLPWKGRDDAQKARWVPISKLEGQLFGSHKVLIGMALEASLKSA